MEHNLELTQLALDTTEPFQTLARPDLRGLYASVPVTTRPGEPIFRLLHLNGAPASNDWASSGNNDTAPLTGRLEVASLDDLPKFAALSYVWGVADSEQDFIFCDSSTCGSVKIPLTTNCYHVLLQLRRRCSPLTLWIDAICINQADYNEKTNQLPLMGQIYDSAQSVFIWLGEGTLASNEAMKCFGGAWRLGKPRFNRSGMFQRLVVVLMRRYIFNLIYDKTWEFSGQGVGFKQIFTKCVLNASRVRSRYSTKNLENILDREWRKRAWTFQEILLARNPVILCGDEMLEWQTFIFGMAYVLARANKNDKIVTPPASFEAWQSMVGLWATVDWYNQKPNKGARVTLWNSEDRDRALTLLQERRHGIRRFLGFLPSGNTLKIMVIAAVIITVLAIVSGILALLIWAGVKKHWGVLIVFFLIVAIIAFGYLRGYPLNPLKLLERAWEDRDEIPLRLLQGGPPGVVFKEAVVHALRERKAGNPRDKSYAMYGILERAGVNLTAVNYAKSPSEVYTDLFADLLSWDDDMLCLILDAGLSVKRTRPSWVPDWRDDGWRTSLDSRYLYFRNEQSATPGSRGGGAFVRRWGHQPTLMLTGQWIDDCSLSYVIPSDKQGETFVKRKPVSKSLTFTHGSLRALVKWMTAIDLNILAPNTRNDLARSIYEVLQGKLFRRDGFQIPWGFEKWLSHFQTFIASGSLAFEQLQTTIDADAETGVWHQLCLETLRSQRSLCVTTGGRFGSGPLEMATGDRVALVSNVPVPLVFRRTPQDSEVYVFIGPAFVAGIMAGELWNDASENRIMVV